MLNDVGVLPDSVRYYHDANAFTTAYLYHIPHAGAYHCDERYLVQRDYLDVCQIIFVDEGELIVEYRGETRRAHRGMIVLLDCHEPHQYYAGSKGLRMHWFHFTGNSSIAYTQLITRTHGFVLTVLQNHEIEETCRTIMMAVSQTALNVHALSAAINKLLALLVLLLGEPEKSPLEQAIQKSADYIERHYADHELSIEYLARQTAVSPCYYMRKFKEYQKVTPHQFLQITRLRAAKQLLMTTSKSIEEIAEACGFCNSSHFIMAFRRDTNLTPLQFRSHWK